MNSVKDQLKIEIKSLLQSSKLIWNESDIEEENTFDDLRLILDAINNKTIRFKQKEGFTINNTSSNQVTTCEEVQKDGPKRKGRPPKISSVPSDVREASSDKSDVDSNDVTTSRSSSKSRRAAAQVAGQKLARVQSLVQLNTKLRRPTNFDEKQAKVVSSPPAKCRRTLRNQSAGSSQSDECGERKEHASVVSEPDAHPKSGCLIYIEKLDTPTITSYTHPRTRSSRSLGRKSDDLFSDSSKPNTPISDPLQNLNKNKTISKGCLNSGVNSAENELWLLKENAPIAQSSPIAGELLDEEFKGFDEARDSNKTNQLYTVDKNGTFSIKKMEATQIISKNTQIKGGKNEEMREITSTKSSSKILRSRETYQVINVEEKENVNRNNETYINDAKTDVSPNLRSRTRVIKKGPIQIEQKEISDEDADSNPEFKRNSRTKAIKKNNEQIVDSKSDNEISDQKLHSRTKTLRKKNEKECQSDPESNCTKYKTKNTRKGNEVDLHEFKENPISNKNTKLCPQSPAPAKGELVKKIVGDFEKMQNGIEDSEEDKNVGRVTRNAIRCKNVISGTEAQVAKQTQNVAVVKAHTGSTNPSMFGKCRATPLGANNKVTPGLGSAQKSQLNKATTSSSRATPVETTSVALIQKEAAEDMERKRKEEEHLKRQAKEEEAKRKKEKALKTTAEETRRKRIEKLQKVAATREAAEKEKERLAAKAEKEKEEKMRQIAVEKERLKKEQLKKKQLLQQKTHELEERRKQEEAARLAKLKEQEEEHKRQQAMRERELELQNQQKAELRIAEAEKMKLQGAKLGKVAVLNNANLKLQHGTTPSDKKNCVQIATNCYEVTPGREDRPLLPPKTENDYGIDDAHSGDSTDDESQPRKKIPLWAQSKEREWLLMVNKYIPKKLWDLFMECDPCPDINKMFAGNPIKKRIRTSSAVWKTPPKFSRVAP